MPSTPSANGTVVTANGGTITDTHYNNWTLSNGQVAVNGVVDPTTANVIELAYVNGSVWQENAGDLWWAKSSPGGTWLPANGTPVSPLFVSIGPISANDTVATAPGQTITDASHNVWSLSAGGQVVTDGVVDPATAKVIELAYVNGQLWQENASHLWWAKSSPGAPWLPAPGTSTSPLPASGIVSANNTVVMLSGQITDANHNTWSISAHGQVVVNGVADPTTANVIALAYENGQLWQENSSDLWWTKSKPSDIWQPAHGTSASPIPTRLWVGGGGNAAGNPANWSPAGVPQPGDTLQIAGGKTINVMGNDLAGDTLTVTGTGSAGPRVTINASHKAQLNLQDYNAPVTLNVSDTVSLNAISQYGLDASGGTIQFIGNNALGHSSVLNATLSGSATVLLAGSPGEGASAEINGAAGPNLTFSLQGLASMQIDHPGQFAGALNLSGNTPPFGTVLLAGLTATRGTLMSGVLSLFNGNQLVEHVRVGGYTANLGLDQTSAGVILNQTHSGSIPLTIA
ncbi:hypothetical protein CCS01_22555 [Rhodopila globiformis]|uniref:Uncharacterized protein n=2 Tax=Rhodopila globiformis TaxID=1071 RepID=A0A2S6N3I4_RHOGL|nr:hypothetical protein CCS01_22555 [Rhodopila globiformis]